MNRLLAVTLLAGLVLGWTPARADGPPADTQPRALPEPVPVPAPALKIAVITTAYFHNSHADVIASRLLQTDTLDGKGRAYPLRLASLYTDQVPANDISRRLAEKYGFPIYDSVADALTLGGPALAVDGVLILAEHGDYPKSPTGNTQYPKRRFFEEVTRVFRQSGRVVPVFIDKHVADNWDDIQWIHRTAREMKIPLMAGSSAPGVWRRPAVDVQRDGELDQIVALSYHTLDAYGFHVLEITQALAERRQGGETGVARVHTLSGEAVWRAMEKPDWDPALFDLARKALPRDLAGQRSLRQAVRDPALFIIEHRDGLKVYLFTLDGAVGERAAAWKYKDGRTAAAHFQTQEARPFMHFTFLLNGVESMFLTGRPAWPVERTVMSSAVLDACLISKTRGQPLETPWLDWGYRSDWNWQPPPPPPPDRPIMAQ